MSQVDRRRICRNMKSLFRLVPILLLSLILTVPGCANGPQYGVDGPYQSWDEVIARWIGKPKLDLFYELGPPNLHSAQPEPEGLTELVWDMTIDRMPGQADEYGLLPFTRSETCQLIFLADHQGIIVSGRRVGCV